MITLRDYQQEAVDSVFHYWKKKKGNPLLVLPCGAGKSIIAGELMRLVMSYPGTRVLLLTHRKELLEQNEKELRNLWPDADTGFFSAGIGERRYDKPVTFAGIQTIDKHIHKFDPFDIVIIDECHLIPRNQDTQYGRTLTTLKQMNPNCRFIGLSATPYRLDSGSLHEGDDAMFDDVSYEVEVQRLVDLGHLCEVTARAGTHTADLTGVRRRRGEFVIKDMDKAFTNDLIENACDQIIEAGKDRRAWLLFCSSVESSLLARDIMRERGIDAEVVTGKTPKREREALIDRFKSGGLKCLINVDVLTIGFNAPICDLCALLRATDSTALYVQIVGRIMRNYKGKKNALLLDFGGNVERHGPIDDVTVKEPGRSDGGGDAPAKECFDCGLLLHTSIRHCPECGYEFPPPKPNIERKAFKGAVMKKQREPELLEVMIQSAKVHKKIDRPDSVQVTYTTADKTVREWLCPEHGGYATKKAAIEVNRRYGKRLPTTAEELADLINQSGRAKQIVVEREKGYDRVSRVIF